MSQVALFNGEDILYIDNKYFFQDPKIEALTPETTVELYQTTEIFVSTMNLIEGPDKGDSVEPKLKKQIEAGLEITKIMVRDLYGEEGATAIFKLTKDIISNESTP